VIFTPTTPEHIQRKKLKSSLGPVSFLSPRILAYFGGGTIAARGTNRLLLVVSITAATAATDVSRLLTLSHGWSTLTHDEHLVNEAATDLAYIN
jgi:hypothetical protein